VSVLDTPWTLTCGGGLIRTGRTPRTDLRIEGWGFESLRARHHRHRRSGSCSQSWGEALNALRGPVVSQFLTALSDLVNLGQRGAALLQVVIARVDVGPLGEHRVVVTRPLADDGDRDARVLTGNRRCSDRVEFISREPVAGGTRQVW
jgi:hypothetical protein